MSDADDSDIMHVGGELVMLCPKGVYPEVHVVGHVIKMNEAAAALYEHHGQSGLVPWPPDDSGHFTDVCPVCDAEGGDLAQSIRARLDAVVADPHRTHDYYTLISPWNRKLGTGRASKG